MGGTINLIHIKCDVLVIGGGGAGLCAAIEAKKAGKDVLIVSKARVGYSNNTFIADGAFSSSGWGTSEDNSTVHLKDTLINGRFINNINLSRSFTEMGHEQVPFLASCGVAFRKKNDLIRVSPAPGHRFPRNVTVKEKTGGDFTLPLLGTAKENGVRFLHNVFISKLFIQSHRICGAAGITSAGDIVKISASAAVLSTGGFARVYKHNNNAAGIFGSGHALCYDLGVPLRDMEFVQYYPVWGTIYEVSVARFGAKLRNNLGEDILEKHGMVSSTSITRDKVTHAVYTEIKAGHDVDGGVIVDISNISEELVNKIESWLPRKNRSGDGRIPVGPCAHYCMGGIVVNDLVTTDVEGLFAAGEISGGTHGANRLGGNALTEVFAMGRMAGKSASEFARQHDPVEINPLQFKEEEGRLSRFESKDSKDDLRSMRSSLRNLMWDYVGIIRDQAGLGNALSSILEIQNRLERTSVGSPKTLLLKLELKDMLIVSEAVCRSALMREESRGAHFRTDFPEEDNQNWLCNIVTNKQDDRMKLEKLPIDRNILSDLDIDVTTQ